jgi:hypothetical protein
LRLAAPLQRIDPEREWRTCTQVNKDEERLRPGPAPTMGYLLRADGGR